MMTVKELKKILSRFEPDTQILRGSGSGLGREVMVGSKKVCYLEIKQAETGQSPESGQEFLVLD